VTRLSLVGEILPGCHVDEGDIFSEQVYYDNRDTSAVGMTAIKDTETNGEIDSE
jgi:hypothetical protein